VRSIYGTSHWVQPLTRALVAGSLCLGSGLVAGAPAALASPLPSTTASAAFNPQSVTFVSTTAGWALGTVPCRGAGACSSLRETIDAGKSWSTRPLPARLVAAADNKSIFENYPEGWLSVRFADPLDGWIFGGLPNGGPILWSTHDGGASWRSENLPGLLKYGPIFDLEAANGTAYLMAVNSQYRVNVESSPVGKDSWRRDPAPPLLLPAGGAQPTGSFIVQDGHVWLVEGNDRGIMGAAKLDGNGRWGSWAPPCLDVGDSYTVPAAASADNLVAVCQIGGFGGSVSKSDPPGAKLGSTWLYFSDSAGTNFHAGPELGPLGPVAYGEVLASPSPGVVLVSRSGTSSELVGSFDGARHWSVVYRGGLFYLGFTTPSQGIGLVYGSSGKATSMVITFDGGHHWSPVKF
jgi:hypothetical protein